MPKVASDKQLALTLEVLQNEINCENDCSCDLTLADGWSDADAPNTTLRSTQCGKIIIVTGRVKRTGAAIPPIVAPVLVGNVCHHHRTKGVVDTIANIDLTTVPSPNPFPPSTTARALQQPKNPVGAGNAGDLRVHPFNLDPMPPGFGIPTDTVLTFNYTYFLEH